MIIVYLRGGLGNQMFEYAAAKGLAAKLGSELQLDQSWFNQVSPEDTPRHYELDAFKLNQESTTPSSFYIPKSGLKNRVSSLLGLLSGRKALKLYREPHFQYDPNLLMQMDDTFLEGYFQTEKYFLNIREALIGDFTWVKPAVGKNKKLLEQIHIDDNSVSIHVRRGDYVSNEKAAEFHTVCSIEYYQAATSTIEKSVKNPHYYVFSDDPVWCIENLKSKHDTTYIDWNTDGAGDMRLMKECKHNIIANSSFSWWGAWLNTNKEKIVIAPKKWFNYNTIDTSDVIPSSWQRI